MKTFADKVKDSRISLGMSQPQLGRLVGVSVRSIVAYEKGEKMPRQATLLKLAKALKVSTKFLTDDACENPLEDIEKDDYIAEARKQYGMSGARDVESLLLANKALFACGELSQEQKDKFFEAVMTSYVTCKESAKEKFGRRDS